MSTGDSEVRRRSLPVNNAKDERRPRSASPPPVHAAQAGSNASNVTSHEPRGFRLRRVTVFVFVCVLTLAFASQLSRSDAVQSVLSGFRWPSSPHSQGGDAATFDFALHPQDHADRTPQTQHLQWRLTSGYRSPDGVKKRVYLINDAFPGPTIEARPGDRLVIDVENEIDEVEGVAIHWHGLHMRGANEMDGAVGFTQCPIPHRGNFTYAFDLSDEQHGTFWYHAHDQVQRGDGLYGGMVIHEPNDDREIADSIEPAREERLLLVGDWYHRSADDVLKWYLRAASFGNEPVPDSVIVNDSGAYNCSKAVRARPVECVNLQKGDLPRMKVTAGRSYRFRVVNTGTLAGFKITVPGANLTVLEVDGGHRVSANTSVQVIGILYPGERMDFAAVWDDAVPESRSYFEVELDEENFRYPNPSLVGQHRYSLEILPSGQEVSSAAANPRNELKEFSLVTAESAHNAAMPPKADTTLVLYVTSLKLAKLHNVPHGFMNHTTWKPQRDPPLPLLALPRSKWDKHQLVPHIPLNKSSPQWVDVVLNNLDDGSHPFHLHGYDVWVLSVCVDGSYWGSYNPFEDAGGPPCGPLNTVNPPRRDTVFVPRRGFSVIRFRADNPGIWMFHCHILWHQASGMAMGLHVGGGENDAFIDAWGDERRGALLRHCPSADTGIGPKTYRKWVA